jgi:hypothetical protein
MAKKRYPSNQPIGFKVFLLVFLVGMLLAVIAGATFVGIKSNGFKDFDWIPIKANGGGSTVEEQKSFQLMLGDNQLSALLVLEDDEVKIDVMHGGNFKVAIAPNDDVDFDFLLDGTLHMFAQADGDYNRAFGVQINAEDGYFVLSKPENIVKMLSMAYEDGEVSDVECDVKGALFKCTVTAESGAAITFEIGGITGNDILVVLLNQEEIIF